MLNYVNGYWNENLGDDLFLRVLCTRYPAEHFITFMKPDIKRSFSNFGNLTIKTLHKGFVSRAANKLEYMFNVGIPLSNSWQIQHGMKKKSNYIEIGGSIFMMPKNRRDGGIDFKRRMRIVNQMNRYFVIGSNFGPYTFDKQIKQYQFFFDNINSVCFRDKYSYSLFKDIKSVQYAPDVVFQLVVDRPKVPVVNDHYVVIVIVDPRIKMKGGDVQTAKNRYDKIVKKMITDSIKNNHKVVLMSFCDREGDLAYCQEVFGMISSFQRSWVQIAAYKGINESLNILYYSQRVVASRYHAMILAWIMRKPVFVISYSEKIINVIQDVFPQQSYFDLLSNSYHDRGLFSLLSQEDLDDLISSSNNQFKKLDQLFIS